MLKSAERDFRFHDRPPTRPQFSDSNAVYTARAMLDLDRLRNIRLTARPRVQRVMALGVLAPNYHLPPRVRIHVEGIDNLPDEPVIFAMNHTDRYNYWPFQYWLWRNQNRFTATWVKGKYYENRWVGKFMELTNNIPAASRGYVLTKDFTATVGRAPSDDEYRAVSELCDGKKVDDSAIPGVLLTARRNVLGRDFDHMRESYAECVRRLMADMMARFVELNDECFAKGLDLLVFPQGTRSIRLSKGRIGLAQVALHARRTIVPVGCNGSDKVYPGGSPWAQRGTITYRFGEPIRYADQAEHYLPEGVEPFGKDLDDACRDKLQGLVDRVMHRINDLVDPEYQFADDHSSDGVTGARRFV